MFIWGRMRTVPTRGVDYWIILFLLIGASAVFFLQAILVVDLMPEGTVWDDPMYATGFLTVLPALWLSLRTERATEKVVQQIHGDTLFHGHTSEFDLRHFALTRMRLWQRGGSWAVGAVVLAGFLYFYDWLPRGYLNFLQDCRALRAEPLWSCIQGAARTMDPVEGWPGSETLTFAQHAALIGTFMAVATVLGWMAGHRFGTLTGSSSVGNRLARRDIDWYFDTRHPDKVAGFRRLADLIAWNGVLASIPVAWLGLWLNAIVFSSAEAIQGYEDWYGPFLAMFGVALLFFWTAFLRPTLRFTLRFRRQKREALRKLEAEGRGISGDAERTAYLARAEAVRGLPDTPIGRKVFTTLVTTAAISLIGAALQIFLNLFSDDPEYHRALTMITEFVQDLF